MSFTVRPAHCSEWDWALEILFAGDDDPDERARESFSSSNRGEISFEHLLLAEEKGEAVGAGLFVPQPGRVAFVWPPGVKSDHPSQREIRKSLLTEIGRRSDELGICLGQVILDPGEQTIREELNQTGFDHLTDLHYMLCPADGPAAPISEPFELETFDEPANASRFAQVLARTYIETLDCPELDGLRKPEEALLAHQATGTFDPKGWRILRQDGCDAGLLLINEHPERELLELVYMGVVPEFRGRGLGRRLVEWAVNEARREARPLVLAVDGRNHFARKIYRSLGFLDLTRKAVHVRPARGFPLQSQSTVYAQPRGLCKKIS